jgi:hypothetical protein
MPDPGDPVAPALAEIREHNERVIALCGMAPAVVRQLAEHDVPRLLKAVEAVPEKADDLTRKSEALDAEAEYVVAEHPEAAAVAVLKRERSIAYDECARWFRTAITAALTGQEPDHG